MSEKQAKSKFTDPMTNLFVKDVSLCEKFYIENFGFIETFRDKQSGIPDHVELKLDNFLLAISSIDAARTIHNFNVETGLFKGELVFWTENVDQAYKNLLEGGATTIEEPHDFRGTLRPARIADPDGTFITIVSKLNSK